MEPWFRRRWYGWQPIHPKGQRLWMMIVAGAVPALAAMFFFAWINMIWVSAVIFAAVLIASFPLNAAIISRTEKD